MKRVVDWMTRIIREGEPACAAVKAEVEEFMKGFPLYVD